MSLRIFSPGAEDAHAAPGHPERPDRVRAALAGIGDLRAEAPAPFPEAALARVHTERHLARVREACAEARALDADTYATRASWDAALRAAGAALAAARSAREGTPAFAIARPPGHHAERDRAMGFCLLSNVALAADAMAREGERVAIVDVDVHHGNGTQDVFAARDDVLFVSTHGWPLYPGTGAVEETGRHQRIVNLPLTPGTGHEGYLEVVEGAILPALRAFEPSMIILSAGFDAHHLDPLGNLALTAGTYHATLARLRDIQPRVAVVLEGGYDLDAVRACSAATVAALRGLPDPVRETPLEGAHPWGGIEKRVRAAHPWLF